MKVLLRIIKIIIGLAALASVIAFIAERIDEIKYKGAKFFRKPTGIYERFIKRPLDCFLSCGATIVLSPVLLYLIIAGAINMKGDPFFTQERPGRIDPKTGRERIFRLIKFRSMTNEKDADGNLLPDEQRLKSYGKRLRASSLDELPELLNIIKGDMAVIGPRPLLVQYLERYNEHQARRHEVRPGLTGYAQAHGRNAMTWEDKFDYDVEYVDNISFQNDVQILIDTVKTVVKREGISNADSATMTEFMGSDT
ncbi:MAG TPA: sugar transferase [Ruminococcus sp.]|nr:sugar transferase [Ruminococcus sp.]